MQQRTRYSEETKQAVLNAIREGRISSRQIAKEKGVNINTVYKWASDHKGVKGTKKVQPTEIKRVQNLVGMVLSLKKELIHVRQERDVLLRINNLSS